MPETPLFHSRMIRMAGRGPNLPETIECYPQRPKKKSTKGHEGPRRATKGLEKAQEGSAKGREGVKDFHQGRNDCQCHPGVVGVACG